MEQSHRQRWPPITKCHGEAVGSLQRSNRIQLSCCQEPLTIEVALPAALGRSGVDEALSCSPGKFPAACVSSTTENELPLLHALGRE